MAEIESPNLRGPYIDDPETVLRLVWDSDDLTPDGELSTSAFSKSDLAGIANGLSVDRKKIAIRSVIERRAGIQQLRAEGRSDLNRDAALLSEATCGDIHNLIFEGSSSKLFATISTPIVAHEEEPANPAHAEIVNISGRSKSSELNKMRIKLQPVFSRPVAFDLLLPAHVIDGKSNGQN